MSAVFATENKKLVDLNYPKLVSFSDLLSVISYDPKYHCFLTEDGRLCRIYQLPNIPADGLTHEDKQIYSELISHALNQYPEGSSGQYIRFDHADIAGALTRFYNEVQGEGFHREIAKSIVERQLSGAKSGFFSTIDDEAIEKAKQDIIDEMNRIEERDEVLVNLDVNTHSGSQPLVTEQYLVFEYTPTYLKGFRFSDFVESLSDAFSNKKGVSDKVFKREMKRFVNASDKIYKAIAQSGFIPSVLTGQGLVDMLYRMLNPKRNRDTSRSPQYNPNATIREIVLGAGPQTGVKRLSNYAAFTDVKSSNSGYYIDGYHYRATSAKTSPLMTEAGQLFNVLSEIEGEGWVTFNFTVQNQSFFRLQLKSRMGMLEMKEKFGKNSPFFRADPTHVAEVRNHLQIALSSTEPEIKDRMLALNTSIHFVSYGTDKSKVEKRAEDLEEHIWRSGYFEKMRGDAIVHYSLPLNNRPKAENFVSRAIPMLSVNTTDLAPFYTGFLGVEDAKCILNNNQGSPCFIDPFTRNTTAPHGLVVGGTGTGKSFLYNFILMMLFAVYRPKIILVDKGGSYKSLAQVVNGEYIYLTTESTEDRKATCINPFYIPPDNDGKPRMPTKKELLYIRGIIIAMMQNDTKENGVKERVEKREKNLILRALVKLYQDRYEEGELTLSDFKDTLVTYPDHEKLGISLAERFEDFTKDGLYGALFDGKLELNWENDFIVFETEDMSDSPALEVAMLVLFHQIETYVKRKLPKNRKKVVGVDEAWAVLADPFLAKQFSGYYRELRKYNCAVFLISQKLADFIALVKAEGDSDDGILPNTRHFYLLGTIQTDYALAKEILGFSDQDIESWRSISSLPPFYSEMFYYMARKDNSGYSGKTRLYSSPVGLWTASTDPDDITMRDELAKQYQKSGLTDAEAKQKAVIELASEYPYGSRYSFKHVSNTESVSN